MPPTSALFHIADILSDALAPMREPISADELIALAQRRTGLTDFGGSPPKGPLQNLLRACFDDANLSLVGRIATRWDVVRFLSNLLRLAEEEKRAPEILAEPIRRPIFISGLPRSGTTFLHTLLAEDPANLVPRVWQMIHPYPVRTRGSGLDFRARRVARQLRLFGLLTPDFRRMHPINAHSPQECSEITAHVFASLRFDTTYRVPGYRRWLDETGHLQAYRFHKRFLQHLQHQTAAGGRWVLKCPDHVFALAAIRAVYPDARLVFVHRDPLAVLLSVARLTETLRRPFTRSIDKAEIGCEDSDRWLTATELMIAAAQEQRFAEPIFHMHYLDLVSDPVGMAGALYKHFGEVLQPEAALRIGRLVEAKPNGGYRAHGSRLEEYGLDAALERERYARYMAHFGIQPEAQRRPVRSAKSSPFLASRRSVKPVK
ncbi:MAG: sulfotransferase [Alphaproteobacteria bacterium]|nr:sulfotransferase [Alphaproteobacteria bacterium]MBV9374576.1 sulfotransferase [Alphaproteobacteria bacterium]